MHRGDAGRIARRAAPFVLLPPVLFAAWLLWPLPDLFGERTGKRSTRVFDRNGVLLYEALSGEETRSLRLGKGSIPPLVEAATVAAEDKRFYSHCGIDPFAVMRAAVVDVRSLSFREGGSTITQQVAKLLMKRKGRGLSGKAAEAFYAVKLETRFTKKEILTLYLNLAPYGGNIVGVRKAAETYFGAPLETLTPAQAAMLAALPKSPGTLDPMSNREGVVKRQKKVLRRLRDLGFISPETFLAAAEERIEVRRRPPPFMAPHFVRRVREEAGPGAGPAVLTTLDIGLQRKIGMVIASKRKLLERIGAENVAVVVLDNRSCEWLAWEGSGNFEEGVRGGAIDGAVTPRQPGSALKPFLYALSFDRGFTPASVLPDIPASYPTSKEGAYYKPKNYDNRFRGPLLARRALAGSVNAPAVFLITRTGVPAFLDLLRKGGLSTLDRSSEYYGYGIALGNAETRLDELAALYSALARGGEWRRPRKTFSEAPGEPVRLVSYHAAYAVTDVLCDDAARQFAFGRNSVLQFPFRAAAKTGTSEGYHDNWAFGYTAEVTVGVWVGNFDRKPLKYSSGVSGAGPIFHEVMTEAVTHVRGAEPQPFEEILERPADLKEAKVCRLSGMAAAPECPSKVTELFVPGALPGECDWHLAYAGRSYTRYPGEYEGWARDTGIFRELPAAVRERSGAPGNLEITCPRDGSAFMIDPTLPSRYQGIYLEALNPKGGVNWKVDGREAGRTSKGGKLFWPLVPGEHSIEAEDGEGRKASSRIVVK